ncbi:hypothetical protein QQ054_29330 [Oscillatoria amoena NRMC-F 0135]|nr:hypothetical protein [Oscillatoria amoena NRMC-F 0135]
MNRVLAIGAGVIMLVIIAYSLMDPDQKEYIATIEKARKEKEHFLRTSAQSPFNDNPANFKGLAFYPVDPAYRIQAKLIPIPKKKCCHSANQRWT